MQKATFDITIPHIVSRLYLQSLHFLQRPNHKSSIQSLTSRFKIHETLLIKQSNFLNFKNYPYEKSNFLLSHLFWQYLQMKGGDEIWKSSHLNNVTNMQLLIKRIIWGDNTMKTKISALSFLLWVFLLSPTIMFAQGIELDVNATSTPASLQVGDPVTIELQITIF